MNERYIRGLEDNNKRMARELHDGVCNRMLLLEMHMRDVFPEEIVGEIGDIRSEVRRFSHELNTPEFQSVNFVALLRGYVEKIRAMHRFNIHLFVDSRVKGDECPEQVQLEMYRILQEGVGNILKHANPESVDITLSRKGDRLQLVIEDDGCGFNTSLQKPGIGMRLMRERVDTLHGDLSVESQSGAGTLLVVSLPLVKAEI